MHIDFMKYYKATVIKAGGMGIRIDTCFSGMHCKKRL